MEIMFCHENMEQKEIKGFTNIAECHCKPFSTAWVSTTVHHIARLCHTEIRITSCLMSWKNKINFFFFFNLCNFLIIYKLLPTQIHN